MASRESIAKHPIHRMLVALPSWAVDILVFKAVQREIKAPATPLDPPSLPYPFHGVAFYQPAAQQAHWLWRI